MAARHLLGDGDRTAEADRLGEGADAPQEGSQSLPADRAGNVMYWPSYGKHTATGRDVDRMWTTPTRERVVEPTHPATSKR